MSISDADLAAALTEAVLDGGSLVPDGGHTEQELMALSFGVWMYEAGRDVGQTAALVSARSGIPVEAEDVRRWRDAGDWGKVASGVNQALVQRSVPIVQGTFAYATIQAISTLVQAIKSPTSTWGEKIRASVVVLDRGGFPPLMRGELFTGITIDTGMDGLTDAELRAQWESYDPHKPVQVADEQAGRHGSQDIIDSLQHAAISNLSNAATLTYGTRDIK